MVSSYKCYMIEGIFCAVFSQEAQAWKKPIIEKDRRALCCPDGEATEAGSAHPWGEDPCPLLQGDVTIKFTQAYPPSQFRPWFDGEIPESVKLKASNTCIWDVDVKEQDGKIVLDGGWPEFVNAHDLKIGYFVVFKRLDTDPWRCSYSITLAARRWSGVQIITHHWRKNMSASRIKMVVVSLHIDVSKTFV